MSAQPEHSVAIAVRDDLRRSRVTVFFRLLLAIPHFVWATLWLIAAAVASILNWFATLFMGRPPAGLHGFLAAFVRYQTHLGAYLTLAANPYPGFVGEPGSYPVDVRIPGPERQSRWAVAFRILLAIPVLIVVGVLVGAPSGGASSGDQEYAYQSGGGVLAGVAFLAWFASLVLGRTPHGLRNFAVFGLRYNAEAASYLFLLTGRYPNSDPLLPAEAGAPPERPIRIVVDDDLRRSRLTVFFRLLLWLPHLVWLALWSVAVFFAAVIAWLVALVIGRVPEGLHRFLAAYIRYTAHMSSYVLLGANPFPGFTGTAGTYPVDIEIDPPAPQRRLVTFFRLFLALPALLLEGALSMLALVAAILGWFASLALGRMPLGLRNLVAWSVRYSAQATGYLLLLTDRYPYSGPPAEEPEPEVEAVPEVHPVPAIAWPEPAPASQPREPQTGTPAEPETPPLGA
jgi:hypothetical protein